MTKKEYSRRKVHLTITDNRRARDMAEPPYEYLEAVAERYWNLQYLGVWQ